MGIITLEKANHLFWLGRYTERVFTTLQNYFEYYDNMIDFDDNLYRTYCKRMAIPDIYGSKEVFIRRYMRDPEDPNSVYSNLMRAFDNGVVMRYEISSTTLAFLQLSIDWLNAHTEVDAPLYDFQRVIDYLYAFWGSADDCVWDEECRNIMKCGRYVERLDLYIRLKKSFAQLEKEFCKLEKRMERVKIPVDQGTLKCLIGALSSEEEWTKQSDTTLINSIGHLFLV